MLWKQKVRFIDQERDKMKKLDEKSVEAALMQLSTEPIHTYLLNLIDELVRQGIYLTKEEQEGAKIFIKILGGEMQKGQELIKRRDAERKKMLKEEKK